MTEGIDGYNPKAIRVLGPHEKVRFTPDAWGYLVALSRAGVLEPAELEHVIDRVLSHFDGRIGLSELRGLLGDGGEGSEPPSITLH